MIYLVGQIGLILAVAAVLFFGLGYWYGCHKAGRQDQTAVFNEDSVTAAAVSVMEDKIKQKDRQISLIQEQMADLESGVSRARDQAAGKRAGHVTDPQVDTVKPEEIAAGGGEIASTTSGLQDDLTKMRGVGKALQKQLNEMGVHSFEQVAQWGKEDIELFSSKLELKDRIRRDDWVGQASKFKG